MPNRLAQEKSLYLRQHADNPVDWYPWGPEAFARAQHEDKPILLSIGYSACHWCHVMEQESFADPEVAEILNAHFVPVKVDREERPDVDAFAMQVCQALTGHGGWPLTLFLTPDGKPFFAGTYFPKSDRHGRPGFLRLLRGIAQFWRERRGELLSYAEQLVEALQSRPRPLSGMPPAEELLRHGYAQLEQNWDMHSGGLAGAPKFPMVPQQLFLLCWWYRTGLPQALTMVEHTLLTMRLGGIYDHVGFGFHRYATDERWRIPHFEKMLSDQALLVLLYAEAFSIRPNPLWERTVREVISYCTRVLRSPDGVFYTSEDADSAGEEGAFYLWSAAELHALLSPEDVHFLRLAFGVEPEGNVPGTGRNLLIQTAPWDVLAAQFGTTAEALQQRWESIRTKLFAYRQRRTPPQRDEKVLTDWNGLLLAALAVAARVFGQDEFATLAQQAAQWFLQQWDAHGRLFHRYAEGEWAVPALLDDYAFLLWGMLELYQTTFDPRFLKAAVRLGQELRERFWDATRRAFCPNAPTADELPLRYREDADGATPAGSAIACWSFLRLAHMTGNHLWYTWAEEALGGMPDALVHVPMAFPTTLIALDMALGPTTEVLCLAPEPSAQFAALVREVHRSFLPRTVLLGAATATHWEELRSLAPAYATYARCAEATAYVCTNWSCQQPVHTPEELRAQLPRRAPAEETPPV
jgi:uncharacterized protein YyaL (SSP411 family)